MCVLLHRQKGERNTETQSGRSGSLEIQSRSISLSSAKVMKPGSLNEKHFASSACGFCLKCSIFSLWGSVTVSIWHLLRQVNSNRGRARDASHWPKIDPILSCFSSTTITWNIIVKTFCLHSLEKGLVVLSLRRNAWSCFYPNDTKKAIPYKIFCIVYIFTRGREKSSSWRQINIIANHHRKLLWLN